MPPIIDPNWTATMLPVAPYTRSLHINLPWNQDESGRYVIGFNWPVDIVGLLFTVINSSDNAQGSAWLVPAHADLVCSLAVSNEKVYTSVSENSDVTTTQDFSDLRALDVVAGLRVTRIIIAGPGELGFNLRWKRTQIGAQRTLSALISASVMYRRCTPEDAREAVSRLAAYSR